VFAQLIERADRQALFQGYDQIFQFACLDTYRLAKHGGFPFILNIVILLINFSHMAIFCQANISPGGRVVGFF
jgi:hypothetical protein